MSDAFLTRQNIALREQNEFLREQVRQLEAMLRPQVAMPSHWQLSPQEQRLMAGLRQCSPQLMSRDRAVVALYGAADDSRGPRIVYVLIANLRRKLARAGVRVAIRNVAARGWHMPPESCAAFDAALSAEQARWPGMGRAAA